MKAALFALTAIMIYAIQNVALEAELKKYHPVALSVPLYIFGFIVCMAHLTTLKGMGQELKFPPYSIIITYVAGYAVFGYFAQFFFLKAYNSGGSMIMITTIVTMLPIAASVIGYLTIGTKPSGQQIAGLTIVIAGLMLFISDKPAASEQNQPGPLSSVSNVRTEHDK